MKHYYAVYFWILLGLGACSSGDGDSGTTTTDAPADTIETAPAETSAETAEATVPASAAPNAVSLDADELLPFREGFAIIKKGESQALINAKGDT
ncbi:hypothetical protein, partial [Corallococcus praedator]|uniref:hypothetical protein n=1 Tax=Corallococcus praedator TaxID=2316724 RepID=UPI001ABFF864